MNLKSLLLSSDAKTVRVLRRVLSDLEIDIEHCAAPDEAIRRITRQRFEAIIVDGENAEQAASVFRGAKASPVNKQALAIVLVEAVVGLKGGFGMGAHFVLHKPLTVERARTSFRAVRALMKRERRAQMRLAVQIPVESYGKSLYTAKTIDLCEGGMAIQFSEAVPKESKLRFSLQLPGMSEKFDIYGELAWEGNGDQAGVRFKDATDEQRNTLRQWLSSQLSEPEQDDPPVNCRLTDLSLGGCYLTTNSPFPRSTRVTLSIREADLDVRAEGIVLVAHPEFGMGVEFLQITNHQRDRVERMIATLRASGDKSPEVLVVPDGMDRSSADDNGVPGPTGASRSPAAQGATASVSATTLSPGQSSARGASRGHDVLVDLFRHKFQVPVDSFLEEMREQRQSVDSRSH
ncbi:MAG: PilZ domain-containing protein [Terriglobales bacterium]|jgi:c-di-GMP-binding flagellar brake protein YcgR